MTHGYHSSIAGSPNVSFEREPDQLSLPDSEPAPSSELHGAVGFAVFLGLFLAVLMGSMDSLVVATALPRIASDLHQASGITFVVSAYLIATTIAVPIFARLSDISSRRNVFLVGMGIFIVGSALAGLSQNLSELILFRGIQGFGGGAMFPVAIAMLTVLYPPAERARLTGFLSAAAGIAIVIGPLVGSYIVDTTTWRWVFYINLPIGIAAIAVLASSVAALRPVVRGRFDTVGALTLAGWVSALMLAVVQVADSGWGWTDPRVLGLLGTFASLVAVFLWWELRTSEPLIPLRLLRQRVIGSSSAIMFLVGIVLNSLITFLSIFVGLVLLHDGPNATNDVRDMIYFLAVPMILGAGLAGQLLTRVSYRTLIAPGLVAAGLAGLFLTDLAPTTPLWQLAFGWLLVGGLAVPLIPLGFGLGLALSGSTIAVQNEAPRAEVGAAIGISRFFSSLGGAVGLSLLTVFLSWRLGLLSAGATTPAQLVSATVSAYSEVFLVMTVLILLAAACAFLLRGRIPSGTVAPTSLPPSGEPVPPVVADLARVGSDPARPPE
jgi:EmrB/QacA subfamily drug resistance transporter